MLVGEEVCVGWGWCWERGGGFVCFFRVDFGCEKDKM